MTKTSAHRMFTYLVDIDMLVHVTSDAMLEACNRARPICGEALTNHYLVSMNLKYYPKAKLCPKCEDIIDGHSKFLKQCIQEYDAKT